MHLSQINLEELEYLPLTDRYKDPVTNKVYTAQELEDINLEILGFDPLEVTGPYIDHDRLEDSE